MRKLLFFASCLSLTFWACNNENVSIHAVKAVNSLFETTDTTWTGGLAEYTTPLVAADSSLKLGINYLPTGLDTTHYALVVTSKNKDASMFTYLKKQVTGLNPGKTYNVTFAIDLATNYPQNIPAGAAVFLKVGASPFEPKKDSLNNSFNLDKGLAGADGKQMVVAGNISNDANKAGYQLVTRGNADKPVSVVASTGGTIWLCVGLDSGFKGTTLLYFDKIDATINQN